MGLRVVQWATGGVGVAAIKGVLEHPDLELVGCWVHSADKAGKDVGELIGTEPLGVTATNSIDEILALDADAVIYAPLMANPDEVAALLRSGKNVVTPVGWLYPSERSAAPMREAALEGNATLHGTGMAPGGISEKFPLLFSAFSTGVTFVRAEEFSDLRTLRGTRRAAPRHGFRRGPGEGADRADAEDARQRLHPGRQDVRRQDGFQRRPEGAGDAGDRGRDRADRLAAGRHRARPGRGPQVPLGGARRRRARRARHGELADGRGKPRSRMDIRARRPAVRDGGARQPGHHDRRQGFPLRGRRRGPGVRHRRHGGALRELGARGVRGRAGHPDLSRPPADQRQGGARDSASLGS